MNSKYKVYDDMEWISLRVEYIGPQKIKLHTTSKHQNHRNTRIRKINLLENECFSLSNTFTIFLQFHILTMLSVKNKPSGRWRRVD
jgi:hypothetical protein